MNTAARADAAPAPAGRAAHSGLYAEVQVFYARQAHLLDAVRAEQFAATFAEDGVFDHSPGVPAARGRADIAREVRDYNEQRFRTDPVQRRHWFNMLDVREQADGTVHTEFYALVVTTRPGEPRPVIAPSCTVRDVLIRERGELRTLSRKVTQDQELFG
ncbi:nuclear transport factor 2 family protein [Streptomyces sp. HUCO-GS316]|uniref:nuclear transport factor 2 family protein n=1 Tax=Streptomyces sp. HUCO-GS316 TaxID=2692198 RepID=UPI001F458B59|nr:nuclear transport factor 2 family protein [Streptomyces sp. HUCO-GS316]